MRLAMKDQAGTSSQTPPISPENEAVVQPVLVRPVAHIRSPILDEHARPRPRPRTTNEEMVPITVLVRDYWPTVSPVVMVGGVFLLFANDQWAMFAAGTTAVAIAMRAVARRITFNFADGFLAFRKDESWPRGVQEEYDVPYAWPSSGRFAPDGSPKAA
jgi:hypothetical protein